MTVLPNELYLKRMKDLLGGEYGEYLKSLSSPPVRALRFNPKKATSRHREVLSPYLLSPLAFQEGGYTFSCDSIGLHPYHHAGIVYVQEPSAMTPVNALDIKPNFRVLDVCASPGGKTTQVAEKLEDGFIVSNEIVFPRAKVLSGNIERLGLKNAVVTCTDSETLAGVFGSFFDLVIADVPCSGEGMFRKEPAAISEWSEEGVKFCAARGANILHNASACVKEGGYLLYSTCTFSLEENEDNVSRFLASHPEFSLVSPAARALSASCESFTHTYARRIMPHKFCGEGQFFALFQKSTSSIPCIPKIKFSLQKPSGEEMKIIDGFFDKYLTCRPDGIIARFKDTFVLLPENLPVPEKITYSCGVSLGRIEKGIFHPHRHLFSSLGSLFAEKLDFPYDAPEMQMYLHGDAFPVSFENSWSAVCVDGVSLGGAKISSGIAKNHYPKGLRNN